MSADGNSSITEIARFLHYDPSTVTTTIDALEARGLVTREMKKTDHRFKVLALTPDGTTCQSELAAAIANSGVQLSTQMTRTGALEQSIGTVEHNAAEVNP